MRHPFSRRGLIGSTFSASLASMLAGSTRGAAQAVVKPDEKAGSSLARLGAAIGASLIGFARLGDTRPAGTVQRKLSEIPSVVDFGAIGDDATDNALAIQQAIDAVAGSGGGLLLVPAGIFRIGHSLKLRSHVRLAGVGTAAVLHLVNSDRSSAILGLGTRQNPIDGVSVRDLTIKGDARFAGGKPSVVNGSGLAFVYANNCEVGGVHVIGFSDGGISFHNGNYNSIANCRVEHTAQAVSFTAGEIDVTGNAAIANRISDTGEYNGLHLEGGFGGGGMNGRVLSTTLSGNTVTRSWEAGINIELAPHTSCVGNTVRQSGMGRTMINMGVKVYGGAFSALNGNTVTESLGDAIVVGADSGYCSINGNTTAGNGGALLVTDSGAQVTNDVAIGINSFSEGDVRSQGNVRIRSRTNGFSFANRLDPDPHVLDWYEEGRFVPVPVGGKGIEYDIRDARFTRIGNVVHLAIRIRWHGDSASQPKGIGGLPVPSAMSAQFCASYRMIAGEHREALVTLGEGQSMLVLAPFVRVGGRLEKTRQTPCELTITGSYLTSV